MKSYKTLAYFIIIYIGINSVFAQKTDTSWTHHQFKSLNLQFDLPADVIFEYIDSTGFYGSNIFANFGLAHLNETIDSPEIRKLRLYELIGIDINQFPINEDPNFQHGTTETGYEMAGTSVIIEDLGEEGRFFIMSDKSNSSLNWLVSGSYGGNSLSGSAGFLQVMRFIKSCSPIEK